MTPDELAEIEDIAVHEGRLSLPWVRRLIAEVETLTQISMAKEVEIIGLRERNQHLETVLRVEGYKV